jgi:hypothetical protein
MLDANNAPVPNIPSVGLTYDTNSGKFIGTADLGSLATGSYTVSVNVAGHLTRRVEGNQAITSGQQQTVSARLVTGDVNNDDALTIQDYNILMSCLQDPIINNPDSGALCGQNANYQILSDLDDNGSIDRFDYNLFVREYSVQNGD